MPRYIDANALLNDVTERYCKDCERRKGIKNGKKKVIYDIGEVPCRACAIDDMKDELENAPTVDAEPTEEQVKEYCRKRCLVIVNSELFNEMKARWSTEPRHEHWTRHGHWIWMGEQGDSRYMCSVCKSKEDVPTCNGEPTIWEYCPNCGAIMDYAVK